MLVSESPMTAPSDEQLIRGFAYRFAKQFRRLHFTVDELEQAARVHLYLYPATEENRKTAVFRGMLNHISERRKWGWGRIETVEVRDGDRSVRSNRPGIKRSPLEIWNDCKPLRATWTWHMRVLVYLYCVEGMDTVELGELYGVSKQRIHQLITVAKGRTA